MSRAEVISQIEEQIQNDQKVVDRLEHLEALQKNPHFRALITEGYFISEPARLASMLKSPGVNRESIQSQLDAIGGLHEYFRVITQMGNTSRRSIQEANSAINDMDSEVTE